MNKTLLAKQAAGECANNSTHQGGIGSRPFWNANAFQFMYAPAFQFQPLPGVGRYRYTAIDEAGNTHAFQEDTASSGLTPIWAAIPEGVVHLTVEALNSEGKPFCTVGARTFFRVAPFPADLPGPARPYGEAAALAFDYAMFQSFIRHWLLEGTPDPEYDLNVYPCKMIASLINAMLYYAGVRPEKSEDALTIAKNAADYLIRITPREGVLKDVPPTYYLDFRSRSEDRYNALAGERIHQMMLIYPAIAGTAYMNLERKTGETRYLEEALRIGAYYRDHVLENGSWHLILDVRTGEPVSSNFCEPTADITPFLRALYDRTGDEIWKTLADGALKYTETHALKNYEWEGQFEDSVCSLLYSNLSHYGAAALARYYADYFPDSPEHMAAAEDLMRFVEDQFVVWKRPAPWNASGYDTSVWHTPAGLEQYAWHMPIDASTAQIASAFLAMYRAGRGELYLAKALALADSLTQAQQPDGRIPTHWMTEEFMRGRNFWINCLFSSASVLAEFAAFLS